MIDKLLKRGERACSALAWAACCTQLFDFDYQIKGPSGRGGSELPHEGARTAMVHERVHHFLEGAMPALDGGVAVHARLRYRDLNAFRLAVGYDLFSEELATIHEKIGGVPARDVIDVLKPVEQEAEDDFGFHQERGTIV